MAERLPYSRVVNVTMTRNDAFPARSGFGTPLFLTTTAVAGVLDAANRTKSFANMDEVSASVAAGSEVYKAMEAAFAQSPRPIRLKAGYVQGVASTITDAELQTQLDAIADQDNDWYFVGVEQPLRDKAALDGLVNWAQAREKIAAIDSNDVGHETAANTTCISARHKNTVDRTFTFYHTDAAEYPAFALAALCGTFTFDDADSAYTAKFKRLRGVAPLDIVSSKLTAATGFVEGLGQSSAAGHMANAQIDIGGSHFVVEGSTLTQNVFIDEVHATDWIIARTREEALGRYLNNKRIAYTDAGMEVLASAARTVMAIADRAELIAKDPNPETGIYEPNVRYDIPSVFSVTEAQRKSRIAPAIAVTFRYAGAVHYSTINYTMNF